MGRSGVLLSFLLAVTLFPCAFSSLQPVLAAAINELTEILDTFMDAVSVSEKQCSRCKDDGDPDCVSHILAKLTDEVSVLGNKVSRLQSDVECDCSCKQLLETKGREPGFIVFDSEGFKVRIIAPNGSFTTETTLTEDIENIYYNPLTDRIFTTEPIKSFNMAFEDEQKVIDDPSLGRRTRQTSIDISTSLTGDPFTETLYFTLKRDQGEESQVLKIGMNGKGLGELGRVGSTLSGGTLDICKGIFYFGGIEKMIKSVNVHGDPHILNVGETTRVPDHMDIDTEAQKIYYCSKEGRVYEYDLVKKMDTELQIFDYTDCGGVKVWNGFFYVMHRTDSAIRKMSFDGSVKETLHQGTFSSTGFKRFTLF